MTPCFLENYDYIVFLGCVGEGLWKQLCKGLTYVFIGNQRCLVLEGGSVYTTNWDKSVMNLICSINRFLHPAAHTKMDMVDFVQLYLICVRRCLNVIKKKNPQIKKWKKIWKVHTCIYKYNSNKAYTSLCDNQIKQGRWCQLLLYF